MSSPRIEKLLALFGLLAAAVLFTGCGSLSYSDPNPGNRFVFPGEGGSRSGDLASNSPIIPAAVGVAATGDSSSKINVGDLLTITFSDIPPGVLPVELRPRINSDGLLTLPYNMQVYALGKTPSDLQAEIRRLYVPTNFVNLTVSVKADDRYYYVGGEVRNPGRQVYLGKMTVLSAIDTAAGFTDFAKKSAIEIRRASTGKTEFVNEKKARKDSKLDLLVFPDDRITVPRKF